MVISEITADPWLLTLKAPFATSQRVAHEAANVRICVRGDTDNLAGFGGSTPVAYVTGESVETVVASVRSVSERLVGMPVERLRPLTACACRLLPESPAALAGLEMAIHDLWAKRWRIPLWHYFGAAELSLVTDLTIPIQSPESAAVLACEAVGRGMRNLKVKIGHKDGYDTDLAMVIAVARAAPHVGIRIDANQAQSPESAIRFLADLGSHGIIPDLLEQPVERHDIDGLRYITQRTSVPVFADESACSPEQVRRLIKENAVDGVNLKLMKCGISKTLESIHLCKSAGLKLMLGCMLESKLGIAAAVQIAAGTGAFDFIDLDSHWLLADMPNVTGGFTSSEDTLSVIPESHSSSGWGVEINL